MPEPEGRSPESLRRRRRALSGWRGALIRWLDPEGVVAPPLPPPASAEAVDGEPASEPAGSGHAPINLVDQAEAFATLRVADVMTPRADIVGLELATPLAAVVRRFAEVEWTRLPVYRETLDDPVGVVHIKDVVRVVSPVAQGATPAWDEAVLDRLKRELLYVPASMRTADLLLRMRAQRRHMALVIDEFGGADGLVTLEDLLEAVVGEIDDEHDEAAEPEIVERPGGLIDADARTPLEDLEARLGVRLAPEDEDEEIDTVGGLVSALAGRVPQRGELIEHAAGFAFEVLEADPRRVRRVRVRPSLASAGQGGGQPSGAAPSPDAA